jgi:hypothetical protein
VAQDVPAAMAARALAGALFALLRQWIDEGRPLTPQRMEEIFHALAERGVRRS